MNTNNLKLKHEYNEYVIGYVITDENTDRDLNFQLAKWDSNHPSPDYTISHSSIGDETSNDWSEEELEQASNYVKEQKDIQKWLKEVNLAKDLKPEEFEELLLNEEVEEYDFFELINNQIEKPVEKFTEKPPKKC